LFADQLSSAHSARILVVDDDAMVLALLAAVLTLAGYDVDTAVNGHDALDRIAARSYDVIVSDLYMPNLDGVGLYRALEGRRPELLRRIAFVSGTTELPTFQRFVAETGVPLLHKPFNIEDLLRFIQQLL
jgi:CheY-like chemotaxis protein